MISIDEALQTILREARPLTPERVPIEEAVGRTLAEDIIADMDLPPFDRAQMDGYAVRAEDAVPSARLRVVGEAAAGRSWPHSLRNGQAVRIMTGAPVPAGAEVVVPIEQTREVDEETIELLTALQSGSNIVPRGSETREGVRLFEAGETINANMIATLAAFGYTSVDVILRPRLTIIATGDELVPADRKPARDQIRDSNSHAIAACARIARARIERTFLVGDEMETLERRLSEESEQVEIIVLSGGVSVGRYDLTKAALRSLGAQIFFERVRLRPGKPTVFAKLNRALVFGLPGNPVSAIVTFNLFVRACARAMQRAKDPLLREERAVLAAKVRGTRGRVSLLPARLATNEDGRLIAHPLQWGGSSDFVSFARAEALIFVPEDAELEGGTCARVLLLPTALPC